MIFYNSSCHALCAVGVIGLMYYDNSDRVLFKNTEPVSVRRPCLNRRRNESVGTYRRDTGACSFHSGAASLVQIQHFFDMCMSSLGPSPMPTPVRVSAYVLCIMHSSRSRSRSVSRSRSRSMDSRDRSRDRKHHSSSHKKSKKRHRSRSPDSPYQSYSAPVEKHKKVGKGE